MNNDFYLKNEFIKLSNLFKIADYLTTISKAKKLLKKFPRNSTIINLIGSCYNQLGKPEEAKEQFIIALQCNSNNLAAMNNLANVYKNIKDYVNAEKLYKRIIELEPKYLKAFVNYGNMCLHLNQIDEANQLYLLALKLDPKNETILYNLAGVCQARGNFSKMKAYAEKLLENYPNNTDTDYLLSRVTNYNKENIHFINMKNKISNKSLNDKDKINLHFSLGKAYEDIFEYEESYNQFSAGNLLKRKNLNYNINKDIKLFEDIKKKFEDIVFDNIKLQSEDKIIFIVGMPRSGTTLIHQIISSHSKVYGAGEIDYLGDAIFNKFFNNNFTFNNNNISKLLPDLEKVKLSYIKNLKHFKFKEEYIIDKSPLNFMWIGFIKLIFPSAKIIYCNRDSNDTCLSLYKNLFSNGLNWSYDQTELATFYNLYVDIMNFWKQKLDKSIFEISYESVVKNPRGEITKMLNFCQLSLEQDCYSFQSNKTPIQTASAFQARRSAYSSSVKLSEKYKNNLNTLFGAIKKAPKVN